MFDPQANVTTLEEADGTSRRRFGRLEQEAVICDIGKVVELSGAGMRVRCRRFRKQPFVTVIRGLGMEITVRGRMVWSKRKGLFTIEAGVEFLDVTPELKQQLTRLGMNNRDRRTL